MSPQTVVPGQNAVEYVPQQPPLRLPYSKPQIIHELQLETQAGSLPPLGRHPLDPLNVRKA